LVIAGQGHPFPLRKISTDEGGRSQRSPFFFSGARSRRLLALQREAAYWGAIARVNRPL
jgi:hypothetical protein